MRLLGNKEFLRTVKPGSLFVEFWMNKKLCNELIWDYEAGLSASEIVNKYHGNFYLFGDNAASLCFMENEDDPSVSIDGVEYRCLVYDDENFVGDASPGDMLNLVFDGEDEYPDRVPVGDSNKFLCRDEVIRIKEWFVNTHKPFNDETDGWALQTLETDLYYKDDLIVTYCDRRLDL